MAGAKRGSKVQDPVPVAPLREFFLKGLERGDFTVCSLAENLGWYRGMSRSGGSTRKMRVGLDTTRVQRMLGTKSYAASLRKNGRVYGGDAPRTFVNYATAVLLCRAMGASPVDMRDENGDPIL